LFGLLRRGRARRDRRVSGILRPARLYLQRECTGVARLNCPDTDHMSGDDRPLRIADLHKHRVLQRRFVGRLVNRALDTQGAGT
jgi:hypothetical protein